MSLKDMNFSFTLTYCYKRRLRFLHENTKFNTALPHTARTLKLLQIFSNLNCICCFLLIVITFFAYLCANHSPIHLKQSFYIFFYHFKHRDHLPKRYLQYNDNFILLMNMPIIVLTLRILPYFLLICNSYQLLFFCFSIHFIAVN